LKEKRLHPTGKEEEFHEFSLGGEIRSADQPRKEKRAWPRQREKERFGHERNHLHKTREGENCSDTLLEGEGGERARRRKDN